MTKVSIVSDTTTLIVLGKLNRYDLLSNLFKKIYIPQEVMHEVIRKDDGIYEKIRKYRMFETKSVSDLKLLSILDGILDKGECEAIVLAKELDKILLIDEKKGRAIAKNMGLSIIGLIGVLILNVKKNTLTKEESVSLLGESKRLGFRISKKLEESFFETVEVYYRTN